MSLQATMVRDDAVRLADDGLEVGVHLPWFRSVPLSCVEACRVVVNDSEFVAADLRFRLGSEEWPVPDLAGLHYREWFVLEEAWLLAPGPDVVRSGATVEVTVELAIRIPDIIIGPNRAFVSRQRVTRRVDVI